MASVGSTSSASIVPKHTNTTIFNVVCTTAGTEYSATLPSNCIGFVLRSRSLATTKLSLTSGESGSTFITLLPGTVLRDDNFRSSQILYFQSTLNGAIIEIMAYHT